LIGTFFGLMANMVQLSELVLASEDGSQQASLMKGLAAVFPSMAAAFTTSLVGVLLSSILWIVGTANGISSLKDELAELLSGYLEQVVQADCRRYSLVGESMERMEIYLTEYLSEFSNIVGDSIEKAIARNISDLVSALKYQVDQVTSLVTRIKDGSEKLSDAGLLFYDASQALEKSSFANQFGEACVSFLKSSGEFTRSSQLLLDASNDAASSCRELAESVVLSSSVTESLGTALAEAKENTVQVLALGVKGIERLKDATGAIEGIQKRGMTWLSMRAKTDQQLMEINSQLNNVLGSVAEVATQVANTRAADMAEVQAQIASVNEIANSLSSAIRQQENATRLVIEGLEQMKSVASRISTIDPQL
jgi:methyl-accepting chemotaxis protein